MLSCSLAMGIRSLLSLRWQNQFPTCCRTQEPSLTAKFARSIRGKPQFKNLLFRRGNLPCFFAFDLLTCDGKDLRTERLQDRKQELRRLLARACPPLKYTEYIDGHGTSLFQRVCELDLEGVVAKQKSAPYVTEREQSTWFKILNREYSQKDGREELFARERHQEPAPGWHSCAAACEGVAVSAAFLALQVTVRQWFLLFNLWSAESKTDSRSRLAQPYKSHSPTTSAKTP